VKPEVQSSQWVTEVLDMLDHSPVECDGFVRLATTLLQEQGIPHKVMRGGVKSPLGVIPFHYWIEIDGKVCDYRARMWLGAESPHGIFDPPEGWDYHGAPEQMNPFPGSIFKVLAGNPIEHYRSRGQTGQEEAKRTLDPSEAYIAINSSGFVDGACFTESEDTQLWLREMRDAGMRIETRSRADAKALLFTQLDDRVGQANEHE
jgi:hypothetical protein